MRNRFQDRQANEVSPVLQEVLRDLNEVSNHLYNKGEHTLALAIVNAVHIVRLLFSGRSQG